MQIIQTADTALTMARPGPSCLPDSVKERNEEKINIWFRKQGRKRIASIELVVQLWLIQTPLGRASQQEP